ncbi:MAG: aminoacetone oxidase family FAD-binding enzyme, partial [Candidatus Omnitrophica bacterium]|nr:aminoacetone oxidase family FAD-binding enzyme [Candidatus Omnitrophota bacterium]
VLRRELAKKRVKVLCKTKVSNLLVKGQRVRGVELKDKTVLEASKVILATGGASYSFTGSDGKGVKIAERSGHLIVGFKPGLVPLVVKESYPLALEGLTLRNIRLQFSNGKNKIQSDTGEMVFTKKGISGPLVLSLSGRVADWLHDERKAFVDIDLKPALSEEQLRARLLREIEQSPRKGIKNLLKEMLPLRLIPIFLSSAGVLPEKRVNQLTRSERKAILSLLKAFRLNICATAGIENAMVSRGGVSLKEIDPRTMVSRIVEGLYFCGEMIDIDADTGGFNLQAAFSTGYLAGTSCRP